MFKSLSDTTCCQTSSCVFITLNEGLSACARDTARKENYKFKVLLYCYVELISKINTRNTIFAVTREARVKGKHREQKIGGRGGSCNRCSPRTTEQSRADWPPLDWNRTATRHDSSDLLRRSYNTQRNWTSEEYCDWPCFYYASNEAILNLLRHN